MALDVTGRIGDRPRRMIALLGVTTLVLAAWPPRVLAAAAGGVRLKPPEDVEVSITDDTLTLRWARGSDPGRNVTFSADYQTPTMNDWMKLPGCQSVASTTCDLSLLDILNINVYKEIKLRVRAEEGNLTSPWHELDPFIPHREARIGPPEVRLEAEDKTIIVNISPPGGEDSLVWAMDKSGFRYHIVSWNNASGVQKLGDTKYPRYLLRDLSPETTYCLAVKARLFLQRRLAAQSPVRCVRTAVENADELPRPEDVRVRGKEQVYVLQWNYTRENVTFQVQWMYAYLKNTGNHEGNWAPVPTCEEVRATRCAAPRSAVPKGILLLRVRACRGNRSSAWSEETEFDTESKAILPAPAVVLKAVSDSSLRAYVGEQSKSEYQRYLPTYEIFLWENTSNVKRKIIEQRADFTIPNLKVLTLYCVRARTVLQTPRWNSSSEFGNTVCERTQSGGSRSVWLVAVVCSALAVALTLCALHRLRRLIDYVFFPSRALPSAIDEYISEQSLKNILLSTSEEQTEKCFIIENIDTVTRGQETNQTDEDHKTYSSQTSEDSGNYSNEDENSSSRATDGLGPEGGV